MTPEQQQKYNAVYPRLIELSEKEERGEITAAESLEYQRLSSELDDLMNQLAPYPPTNQN